MRVSDRGVLADYLKEREKEVVSIMIMLFDQEYAVNQFGKAQKEEGRKEGWEENQVSNVIVHQVRTKGKFYRIKTFIDIISIPMLTSMENLFQQSLVNSAQGRTILAKKRKLEAWKKEFEKTIETQIAACIAQIQSELDAEIAAFAEEHFADNNADRAWQRLLRERRIQDRCQELMEELESQCNDTINEISREISNELNYVSSSINKKSFRGSHIIDGKRIWNWSATIIGGGLTIGSIIAGLAGAAIMPLP